MTKAILNMRNEVIENSASEKILEQSGILSSKLTKKEESIKVYIFEMIASKKIGVGYQFGLKRFNAMFVNWENGKATEKASIIPTVKEISNACKAIYKDCKEFGFFPIVKTNSDGAIIIDCIKWVEGFYSEKKPTEKKSEKTEKPIEIDFDMLCDLLRNSDDVEMLAELRDIITETLDKKVTLHKVKKSA